jgi:hypothetical protein
MTSIVLVCMSFPLCPLLQSLNFFAFPQYTVYLPVFFQASKGASPIRSAIDIFGSGFSIPPFGILGGVSVLIINRYSPQNYIGWILSLIGFGLMTLLDVDTPMGKMIGYQLLLGAGLGILFTSTVYPVLASMPVDKVAPALALFIFVRTFAQVCTQHPSLPSSIY